MFYKRIDMKKEDLIVKWLDNNLDEEELKAFKKLDASSAFIRIDEAAKKLAAPSFDSEAQFARLKEQQHQRKSRLRSLRRTVASIAAVFILGLGLFYTLNNPSDVTFCSSSLSGSFW